MCDRVCARVLLGGGERRVFDVPRASRGIQVLAIDGFVVLWKFVIFQVEARNVMGVVYHGSPRLRLNMLARDLFWFGLEKDITLTVEWVPRKDNTVADELPKLPIPEDSMLSRQLYLRLEELFGQHSVDLFASNANNQCLNYYSLH